VTRLTLVVGSVVLAGVLLTGCAAAGPSQGDPVPTTPVDQSDDSGDNGGADGGDSTGLVQGEIPDTYPREDVPLVESGEVVFAVDLGTGWTVIFASDDPLADFVTARDELVGAGFTVATEDANDEAAFAQLQGQGYTVNLSAGNDRTYGDVVSYTVVLTG
jgi:hypothetical protein